MMFLFGFGFIVFVVCSNILIGYCFIIITDYCCVTGTVARYTNRLLFYHYYLQVIVVLQQLWQGVLIGYCFIIINNRSLLCYMNCGKVY